MLLIRGVPMWSASGSPLNLPEWLSLNSSGIVAFNSYHSVRNRALGRSFRKLTGGNLSCNGTGMELFDLVVCESQIVFDSEDHVLDIPAGSHDSRARMLA